MTSAENLVAEVTGNIAEKNGVLKITGIHLIYHFKIPFGMTDKAQRALALYSDHCPAYQSVKGCIDCSWEASIVEG